MPTESIKYIKPSGQGGDYTTLTAWDAGEARDLTSSDEVAIAEIAGDWTGVTDSDEAVLDTPWVADATRKIIIRTASEARHAGVWDDSKYNRSNTLRTRIDYVDVDGLQLSVDGNRDSFISNPNRFKYHHQGLHDSRFLRP